MPDFTTRPSRPRSNPVSETVQMSSHLGSRLFDAYYDAARGMWDLWVSPRTPFMRLASAVAGTTAGLVSGLTAGARRGNEDTQEIILDVETAGTGMRPRSRRVRAGSSRPS
jgi:hypothetical protein